MALDRDAITLKRFSDSRNLATGSFKNSLVKRDQHIRLHIVPLTGTVKLSQLAIDGYSRMIVGDHISLDHPSAFGVGLCLCHAFLPKVAELSKLAIQAEWPVWGLMRKIHADNGKDFRSASLKASCDEYGIDIQWRPVRTPHFGGHIERLMGTVAKEIHALPGTTFSNPKQRGGYNAEAKAVMTLPEIRRWLVQYIVGIYPIATPCNTIRQQKTPPERG